MACATCGKSCITGPGGSCALHGTTAPAKGPGFNRAGPRQGSDPAATYAQPMGGIGAGPAGAVPQQRASGQAQGQAQGQARLPYNPTQLLAQMGLTPAQWLNLSNAEKNAKLFLVVGTAGEVTKAGQWVEAFTQLWLQKQQEDAQRAAGGRDARSVMNATTTPPFARPMNPSGNAQGPARRAIFGDPYVAPKPAGQSLYPSQTQYPGGVGIGTGGYGPPGMPGGQYPTVGSLFGNPLGIQPSPPMNPMLSAQMMQNNNLPLYLIGAVIIGGMLWMASQE